MDQGQFMAIGGVHAGPAALTLGIHCGRLRHLIEAQRNPGNHHIAVRAGIARELMPMPWSASERAAKARTAPTATF